MTREGAALAKHGQAEHEKHPETVCFATVLKSEHKTINDRRKGKRPLIQATFENSDKDPVYDTVGLALSGGGIRSAAFCLGALQSLEAADALKRVDYLSTVSGGGYTGTCWSGFAACKKEEGLPFPSVLEAEEPAALRHIRDHSNYLIPHGVRDVLISIAIYLRGIAANVLLVLPWLLLAAAVTIFLYPTRSSLEQPLFGSGGATSGGAPSLAHFSIADRLGAALAQLSITAWLGLALFFALVFWSLWKSSKSSETKPEVPGIGSTLLSWFFIILAVSAFCELQPWVLTKVFAFAGAKEPARSPVAILIAGSTTFATVVGLFGNKLTWIVKQATDSATYSAYAAAIASKALLYAAAAVMPLILWVVYLLLCYWGIADTANTDPPWPSNTFHAQWMQALAGELVRQGSRYPIAWLYFLFFIILFVISFALRPNANSLHRLYRDRLSNAFLFESKQPQDDTPDPVTPISYLPFNKLRHEFSPYHLINAALNIQGSRQANQRGRDADFFLFSANYVGSDDTRYIKTEDIEPVVPALDLGTAMAISGAAAASNMGANLREWSITLALLNVRLGFWFPNPEFVKRPRLLKFLRTTNVYLLSEMFGFLTETKPYVYLTDGGHIENLGLYQLLRRRCSLIIVIDAEADPKMTFSSFIKAERYARIDLGTRIELPWYDIRDATLETNRVIAERGDSGDLISNGGPHCALGTIRYPNGNNGVLLYIKSSLTGDENDYVINYKSRHASFPHETTGDQFFSEEQFEAYRNLGFHATQGFFSERDKVAMTAVASAAAKPKGTVRGAKAPTPHSKNLRLRLRELLGYRRPEGTLANVTRSKALSQASLP